MSLKLSAAGALALSVFGFLLFLVETVWAFERGFWPLGILLLVLVGVYAGTGALAALGLFVDWLFPRRKV